MTAVLYVRELKSELGESSVLQTTKIAACIEKRDSAYMCQ